MIENELHTAVASSVDEGYFSFIFRRRGRNYTWLSSWRLRLMLKSSTWRKEHAEITTDYLDVNLKKFKKLSLSTVKVVVLPVINISAVVNILLLFVPGTCPPPPPPFFFSSFFFLRCNFCNSEFVFVLSNHPLCVSVTFAVNADLLANYQGNCCFRYFVFCLFVFQMKERMI